MTKNVKSICQYRVIIDIYDPKNSTYVYERLILLCKDGILKKAVLWTNMPQQRLQHLLTDKTNR